MSRRRRLAFACTAVPLRQSSRLFFPFFFFNDTATTEIYTLSLHDALPISGAPLRHPPAVTRAAVFPARDRAPPRSRSEEHTSELQSHLNLVCRLLLEKKKAPFSTSAPQVAARAPLQILHYNHGDAVTGAAS